MFSLEYSRYWNVRILRHFQLEIVQVSGIGKRSSYVQLGVFQALAGTQSFPDFVTPATAIQNKTTCTLASHRLSTNGWQLVLWRPLVVLLLAITR